MRKITFPLVLPAILSGVIMTFSKVMGTFGGPNILGTPMRYYVVATMIRGSIGAGQVVSGMGRGIALDRDGDYNRTRQAYDALVFGAGRAYPPR